MSCNVPEHGDEFFLVVVSIPIGFSNELQLRAGWPRRAEGPGVSIPIGFSNELQR